MAIEDLQWPRDDSQRPCTDNNVGLSLQPVVTRPHEKNESLSKSSNTHNDAPQEAIRTRAEAYEESWCRRTVDFSSRRGNLSNLRKAYTGNSDRYGGSTLDNFNRKYALFNDRYD